MTADEDDVGDMILGCTVLHSRQCMQHHNHDNPLGVFKWPLLSCGCCFTMYVSRVVHLN